MLETAKKTEAEKNKEIQELLKFRIAKGMESPPITPAQLAKANGVSSQAVNGWLTTGKINNYYLPGIASAIGESVDWLFDRDNPDPTEKTEKLSQKLALLPLELQDQLGAIIDTMALLIPSEYLKDYDSFSQKMDGINKSRNPIKNKSAIKKKAKNG